MPEIMNMNSPGADRHGGQAVNQEDAAFSCGQRPAAHSSALSRGHVDRRRRSISLLRSLPDNVAHLDRRSRKSRFDSTFHLLHVARKLVVILRRLLALPFRSRPDQPSGRVYEAISLCLPVDGIEAPAPRLIRRRRQESGERTRKTGAARLVNYNFSGRAQGPSTVFEERSSAHRPAKRRANRSSRHICVPLCPSPKLGFKETSTAV